MVCSAASRAALLVKDGETIRKLLRSRLDHRSTCDSTTIALMDERVTQHDAEATLGKSFGFTFGCAGRPARAPF